jgi:two-component system, OmpR family, response regulator RegX3
MSARILLVEDEEAIAEAVGYALAGEGYAVDAVRDGERALEAARSDSFDLVLLDLVLPRMSGVEVCRRLRAWSSVPIIMLTALGGELDRVLGLDAGADDYVTKPFSVAELLSRVRAILRRRELDRASGSTERWVGELRLDFATGGVDVDGRRATVTPSEFKLLALLATAPDRVFTRREIVQHLHDSAHVGDERGADVHMKNLRKKIEVDPGNPQRLLTVRGVGYMLRTV